MLNFRALPVLAALSALALSLTPTSDAKAECLAQKTVTVSADGLDVKTGDGNVLKIVVDASGDKLVFTNMTEGYFTATVPVKNAKSKDVHVVHVGPSKRASLKVREDDDTSGKPFTPVEVVVGWCSGADEGK